MKEIRTPIIGLTCSELLPTERFRPTRYGQNGTYIDAVLRAGGAPVLVPEIADPAALRSIYHLLDGLLLPGGEDVHPEQYGEPLQPYCGKVTPGRDRVELTLARWAMSEGKPLLAVCRGIQILNVALGGSLYQDIETQVPGAGRHPWYPDHPRDRLSHDVTVTAGTRLAALVGEGALPVNSLHHQAIKQAAPRLMVTARAPDGVVEAVEAPDHPYAVAVQWHPEELAAGDPRAQRLFDALVEACRG